MEPIPSTWIDAISKLGFPAVLLLGGAYVAFRFGRSFHATVIIPLVQAHLNFLSEQNANSKTIATAMGQQASSMAKQCETIDAIKESQTEMSRSVRLLAEMQHRSETKNT